MQKPSLPNHDFDPKTSPNRFDSLRLGSSVDDDATNQTNVMFTDPCSLCGNKKRRVLTPQESRKKISIDPNSINNNSPSPTTTTTTSSSPPLIAVTPNTNNNVNSPGSFITTTPESKNNNNLGSSGRSSPATAPLPPRPPVFRRSVSDPTPSSKSRKELFFPTTVSGEVAEESPAEKRWKKLRERLTDMKDLVNSIVEDEDQEDDDRKDEYTPENDVSEVVVPDNTVGLLEVHDGDTLAFTHRCCCGNRVQFCLSVRSI